MANSTTSVRAGVGAAGLLGAALAAYLVGVGTYVGQRADQTVMTVVSGAFGVRAPTSGILGEVQVPAVVALGAALVIACLRRPMRRRFAHALVVVLGSIGGAIVLKYGLARPGFGVGPISNSFPSNTVAVFAGLALALAAAVPRTARRWTAAGGTVVVAAVSTGVIALQWHRPSDVVGGLLVAGAAAAAAHAWFHEAPDSRFTPSGTSAATDPAGDPLGNTQLRAADGAARDDCAPPGGCVPEQHIGGLCGVAARSRISERPVDIAAH